MVALTRTEPDLHVLYSFPGRLGRTGIGTTAWSQIQGLIREGARVHVHCGTCDRPIEGAESLTESFRLAGGIRIPYRLLGISRMWAVHDLLVSRALAHDRRIRVVHCWPIGAKRTLETARRLGVRSFLERPNAHTAFAYEVVAKELARLNLELPKGHSHAHNGRQLAREEQEYALADYLLCPSEFVAKSFVERGISPQRIMRHQYGFDPARFSVANGTGKHGRPARAEAAGGADGGLTAAFVGSCEPRKGLHFALEAWHASGAARNGKMLICGRFVPGYREQLAKWLDHPSIEEIGFTDDVPAVMRRADVLVLPSIEEGSALVTYEARACGCVLMVSDAAGAPCEHMHDGLIHPSGDVATLTEHFELLSRDRDLLERLRDESLHGLESLTWQSAARRLVDVYRGSLEVGSLT